MLIPIFELFYEQKNITKDVSSYVTSIEYTDAEHDKSDELQITFEDSEKLLNCGQFEIDELEYDTPPDVISCNRYAKLSQYPLILS